MFSRLKLKELNSKESCHLFCTLYQTWSHSQVPTFVSFFSFFFEVVYWNLAGAYILIQNWYLSPPPPFWKYFSHLSHHMFFGSYHVLKTKFFPILRLFYPGTSRFSFPFPLSSFFSPFLLFLPFSLFSLIFPPFYLSLFIFPQKALADIPLHMVFSLKHYWNRDQFHSIPFSYRTPSNGLGRFVHLM